jgi:hypothetical protein
MTQLDLKEARSLASLFGELDRKRMVLLILFDRPGSKWDKRQESEKLPKSDRISTATLYRSVDELLAEGFLEETKGHERRARGGATVVTYNLTLKGYFAEAITARLLLEERISAELRRRVEEIAKTLDSSPGWPLFIEFLRWHRKRGIDLSRVSIDGAYFGSILWLALIEHPKEFIWEHLQPSVKTLGLDLIVTDETVADLKRYYYDWMRSFGDRFLAEVTKKTLTQVGKSVATKLRKSERTKH